MFAHFSESLKRGQLDIKGEGDGIVGTGELKIPHNKGARFALAVQPQCWSFSPWKKKLRYWQRARAAMAVCFPY